MCRLSVSWCGPARGDGVVWSLVKLSCRTRDKAAIEAKFPAV
jgi:hypothetical protein